jgi:hypothetical protein
MPAKTYSLNFVPGIQRDGTGFSSRKWSDGQWCRFYRTLPQKMGGYKQIITTDEVVSGCLVVNNGSTYSVYIGTQTKIQFFQIDQEGVPIGGLVDITPLGSPVDGLPHIVSFGIMYSSISNSAILLAYAAHDVGGEIATSETPIYYTDLNSANRLVNTNINVSGGFVTLYPFLFAFGNDGDVRWTAANDPTTVIGDARVTSSKIMAGLPTRGGGASPAGLLWSLDSLIRVTFTGTTDIEFSFDTVTSQSSLLSASGIIEYDSIFYWAGVDRFLVYNGVVQELPNDVNLQYFFDNLNYTQRQKVWATKITEYGEIWWHYPRGNSTECNAAIIYNVRERTWYDSSVSRSSGYFNQVFDFPIWTSSESIDPLHPVYPIWIHEYGTDQDINGVLTPIYSTIESGNIAWCSVGPDSNFNGIDRAVLLSRVEPDMVQAGNINLIVKGRAYARSPSVDSDPYVFSPNTIKIDLNEQRREMTLKFESDVIGGDYEFGQTLMLCTIGDGREGNATT